ncbi:MAG TPA: hypothetical protein VEU77_11385 [Candidatus Acidoferrales bacterium]|nr:hypothetical protein [Candidatus Acidoferrales bacterium]
MTDNTASTRTWAPGALLIALGLMLLAGQWLAWDSGPIALAVMAGFFLAMYANTRVYGFLIPAFIFGGLAAGVGIEDTALETNGGAVVLGLGLAFLGLYVMNVLLARRAAWWPLIPGVILGTVGTSLVLGGTDAARFAAQMWPLALILAGLALIAQRTIYSRRA